MITEEQLKAIMPRMAKNPKTCKNLIPHLNAAMDEALINSRLRVAAFLAQLAHESGEFKYMEELWGPSPQQLRYDPPTTLAKKLGNTQPGDGFRYKGRGPIQLTGRENYRKCGLALDVDLEAHPDLAGTWGVGFRVAAWYWVTHKLNQLADSGDFDGITKGINGGFNGKPQRDAYYAKALSVLT